MEFAERQNRSKIYCCVYGCNSRSCRDPTLRFYHFPREKTSSVKIINKFYEEEMIDRRTAWIKVLNIGKKVTPSMRVCSLHFSKEDFILPHRGQSNNSAVIHLKRISVPSFNLPSQPTPKMLNDENSREERRRRRSLKKCLVDNADNGLLGAENLMVDVADNFKNMQVEDDHRSLSNERLTSAPKEFREIFELRETGIQAEKVDIGIQVQSDSIIPKFITLMKKDHELSTLTGISTFKLLETIEELVKMIKAPSHTSTKLALREKIIMTFMKFKQNSSYATLAILFQCCSADTCKRSIFNMIDVLNVCLKPSIFWPSKDNIQKNLPSSFKGLEGVRVVVDCTEIRIQKPSKLCCQLQTYSHYKTTYTIKFMTGVTPAGMISFVSKPYGGRVSDNIIFEQSGILKKMDRKDIVMADKGFTMEDLCRKNDVTLLTPFFRRNKVQFSKEEAITSRHIAKARVHVERANQRLKTFAVLGDTMPICLLSKVEEIFNIITGVVNLSAPILKNDKFLNEVQTE